MAVDQKATVKLSTTVNDNIYTFEMPMGAQFGSAYDAGHLFLQEITKMANDAAERVKRESGDGKKEEDN